MVVIMLTKQFLVQVVQVYIIRAASYLKASTDEASSF
jgi:hypothetical protein